MMLQNISSHNVHIKLLRDRDVTDGKWISSEEGNKKIPSIEINQTRF